MNYYIEVLKKYAVFTGRATRTEYWMFTLVNIAITVVLSVLGSIIHLGSVLNYLYALAVLLPAIAVSMRRLHDTNRSGWWLLISLVPFLGALVLIIFFVMDSTPGDNKYGSNPKGTTTPTQGASSA